MGMSVNEDDFNRVTGKLAMLFENLEPDLRLVGEVGATAIVQTTLAGIGEGDQPFAPYSPAYKALLDAVGGKPRQTVDLRGLFYHEGQTQKKYRSEKVRRREAAGRQAYIGVAFASLKSGVRSFTGKTGVTRPQLGLTDPRSEMSLDLIHVEVADKSFSIIYESREKPYMIAHQDGDNHMPMRKWFTANKAAVRAGLFRAIEIIFEARASWFNDHGNSGSYPAAGKPVKDGGGAAARDAMSGNIPTA